LGNNILGNCSGIDKNADSVDLKESRRVKLTKKMMKDALIELLCNKPLGKITITEICEKADINRTTFYKYYSDEHSLFLEIEKDYYNVIDTEMKNSNTTLLTMLNFFKENSTLSRVLFASNTSPVLGRRIFQIPQIRKAITDRVKVSLPHDREEKLLYFLFSGGYALVVEWIRSDFEMPTEELASMLNEFIRITAI